MSNIPEAHPAAESAAGIDNSQSAVAEMVGSAVAATPTLTASDAGLVEDFDDSWADPPRKGVWTESPAPAEGSGMEPSAASNSPEAVKPEDADAGQGNVDANSAVAVKDTDKNSWAHPGINKNQKEV